jgi:hypothetical protein
VVESLHAIDGGGAAAGEEVMKPDSSIGEEEKQILTN